MQRRNNIDYPLWAITSYYNPSKFRRRLANYKRFCNSIEIPLVTAELTLDGSYELGPEDADVLIQIRGSAPLWHKESLLNIALASVPSEVPYIAWLDCDVFFERNDWSDIALAQLQYYKLVQLFSELRDLSKEDSSADTVDVSAALKLPPTGHSIAHLMNCNGASTTSFAPKNTTDMRTTSFGIAWAASTSLLRHHGFYDAMIIGSGDRAMACAAFGEFEAVADTLHLSPARMANYLNWARPYFESVSRSVGHLPGAVFHLWHGSISDRRYKERHRAFADIDFMPDRDLERDSSGTWRWKTRRPDMDRFFRDYFDSRQEDGFSD